MGQCLCCCWDPVCWRLIALGVNKEEIQQGCNQAMCAALDLMESNKLVYSMLSEPRKQQQATAQCCVLSLGKGEDKLIFDPSCR